ncbi:MAG: hypothetical protein ACJ75S_03885 [Solirubrobacterales bacterium]
MRLGPAATVGILFALAPILSGCGGRHSAAAGMGTVAPRGAQAGVSAATRTCRAQLHDLLGSMDALRRKLAVGLRYDAYLHEVRAVRNAYDGVPVDRLGLGCLVTAGTPAERALNRYTEAANTWGDCLASASCDSESVEPKLQHEWALASERLSSVQKGLRGGGR